MNTPSHWLIHATIARRVNNPKLVRKAFLWGAVAPDIPLLLMSLSGALYFRLRNVPLDESMPYMFDRLYFNHPFWITGHHVFHAPLLLGLYALVLYPQRQSPWAQWLLWFIAGCALHTLVDILTHYNDGPLVFFPLNWHFRVQSISYWDPEHGSRWFAPLELALDLFLLGYLLVPWIKRKRKLSRGQ